MYIEVSGKRQGAKAQLVSPTLIAHTGRCSLRLWYHMKGSDIQDLKIWYRTFIGGPLHVVDSLTGNKGDIWNKLVTTVRLGQNIPFEVIIEGLHFC